MRKLFFLSLLQLILFSYSIAQDNYFDSLRQLISTTQDDTLNVQILLEISAIYVYQRPDSGLVYAKKALELSKKLNYTQGEAKSYFVIGSCLSQLGDYAGALSFQFKNLKLSQEMNDTSGIILAREAIGTHYRDQGDYRHALKYLLEVNHLTKSLPENGNIKTILGVHTKNITLSFQNAEIGFCYITSNPDSALLYATKAKNYDENWLYPLIVIGNAYLAKNQPDSSLRHFRSGLTLISNFFPNDIADTYIGIAKAFKALGKNDSCIFYAKKGLDQCDSISYLKGVFAVTELLASVYENIDPAKSIQYYKINKITGDSLFSKDKERQVQSFAFNEQLSQLELQQKLQQSELQYRNRLNIYILLAGLIVLLIVAGGLWRRNIFKQKSYSLLQKQKQETEDQRDQTNKALEHLQQTQAQLIQAEKMASLGELTAGIAHEIQNPLNFVNNFSEVSNELIDEMQTELDKGDTNEAKVIANDVKQNLEKILHHGKRADAIVKGMLQHSRSSSGVKEPTDINALADEYLRLAYHGLRAKDKSFNGTMKTDFDESIGNINIIPQDIGRVILNLITNAFYAVTEKKKSPLTLKGEKETTQDDYEPIVTVSTRRPGPPLGDRGIAVEIRVKDNGNGIPQKIVDKIFQPFFTTKPTGQGTGLGLSLAYDIIKAHGGELKVETVEGEGAEFVIQLPIV